MFIKQRFFVDFKYGIILYDRHKTAMIILHLILHSKVHIYDFHTFITSDTKQLTKRDIKRFIKWSQRYKCTINFSDFNGTNKDFYHYIHLLKEMIFRCHVNKTDFPKKCSALGLTLKVRVFGTRKWPIALARKLGSMLLTCNNLSPD